MSESWRKLEHESAARVREMLTLPQREQPGMGPCDGEFDPWALFPAVYGSYSSDFDDMAIAVLTDIKDRTHKRDDLASEMFREMLCVLDLCDYGSSPRVCFPNSEFKEMLPELIEKWKQYSAAHWRR